MIKNIKNSPKVSIGIAVYNGQKTLERCIKSILKQTYSNIEIIIIDDCSTDLSNEICKSFAKTWS